jgi:hypothetical protein
MSEVILKDEIGGIFLVVSLLSESNSLLPLSAFAICIGMVNAKLTALNPRNLWR